ncbi:class I SAM-dependent methyltransferase [Neisseria canis]|uniref:Biotin biosynthesis protein BioC n=1 Tax=Neisseria canis TaxID=493 RepID=A0A448D8A6_9NEIS|nr:class I SAM-dependent methyltransferase [Neisseria canis]OSI12188.1 SAM-dependent methyltransferase [Neisseria canis]VEF01297.1 biotin biosynthesis protein BioC [Neisseria canis]
MNHFKDHFSALAERYAAYRPVYPNELAATLAQASPQQHHAWDCACGTGQMSVLLAEHFSTVSATDASEAQIKQVRQRHNIRYSVAAAEQSGLPDNSADLITVAQAAHWFDLSAFYREATRVARPNALIALISYATLTLDNHPEADALVQRFYHQDLAAHWPPERRHVENAYGDLPFPFEPVMLSPPAMRADWRLPELLGYLSTWSAVRQTVRATGQNPLARLAGELTQICSPDTVLKVSWPLNIRAGKIQK